MIFKNCIIGKSFYLWFFVVYVYTLENIDEEVDCNTNHLGSFSF